MECSFIHGVVALINTAALGSKANMTNSIAKDLSDFLKNGDDLCDGRLVSTDGTSFAVHKTILAARS